MSAARQVPEAQWVKSSYSNSDGGGCVEWAPGAIAEAGWVPVRDSKVSRGPVLEFGPDAFAAFVSAVRQGELDGSCRTGQRSFC